MRRRTWFFLLLAVVIVTLTVSAYYIWKSWPDYPEERLSEARRALSKARASKAETYAPSSFKRAASNYDTLLKELDIQAKKWFLGKDYSRVDSLGRVVIREAEKSLEESRANQKKFNSTASRRMEDLRIKYSRLEQLIGWLPLSASIVKAFSEGRLLLAKATTSNENGNLIMVNQMIDDAEEKLQLVMRGIDRLLKAYFEDYPKWMAHKEEAYQMSANDGTVVLLVDKFGRKCYVVDKGVTVRSYVIELGRNWIGDKKQKGDKTTPEGVYKVARKKKGRETKYHKALLLDYPNEDDLARFKKLKSEGELPQHAQIGGLIEIHGGGGRGTDWTDGCIALTNDDMDELYSKVKTGNRIVIVGSTTPLEKIVSTK